MSSDETDDLAVVANHLDAALRAEAAAIVAFADRRDDAILRAARAIAGSGNMLVLAGIGKSGHIARKIASTFCSIGKPAMFLHPSEASHGDLGLLQPGSIVVVLSNSGETSELSDLLKYCEVHGMRVISITGNDQSTLARQSEIAICYGRVTEVCPNGLAPTTSTTLSLAIGDALAVGAAHLLGTAPEDFRRYHPSGTLGARLMHVGALAHRGDTLPIVAPETPMSETVATMSEKALGVAIVMSGGAIEGIITDGDLRRHAADLWSCNAGDIATPDPITVEETRLVSDVVPLMTATGITSCLVMDANGGLVGLLHIHDCLRHGFLP